MEILTLIFSGPGATIVVCLTILVLAAILLLFPNRLKGLTFGYKDIKLELPTLPTPQLQPSVELLETPPTSITVTTTDGANDNQPPLLALWNAVDAQDRKAIQAAYEKLVEHPPFGFSHHQLEMYKYSQMLRAGFLDALEPLQEAERKQPGQVDASLHLARYYLRTRSSEDAERHLTVAESRARTDSTKVDVALLRAQTLELLKTDGIAAIKYLERQVDGIEEKIEKSRIFAQIARLHKGNNNDAAAIIAYENALECNPQSSKTRFNLALIYGTKPSLKMLAVRHYRILLEQNPANTGALNNLGLLYGEFGIPIGKISLIKDASTKKDAHATGNLATLYVEAGFLDDAEKVLNAQTEGRSSERIISAYQHMQKMNDEQAKKKAMLVLEAEKLANYMDYDFCKVFNADAFLGSWVEADNGVESTLEIERKESYLKFIKKVGDSRLFGYCHSQALARINHLDFSKEDKPPLYVLWVPTGEIGVAILFGDATIRIIQMDDAKIYSKRDYRRSST